MSTRPRALVIDDEPDILELLTLTLGRMDIDADTAANINQAKQCLAEQHYDLCFTDMKLPDGDGIDLVKHIQTHYNNTPVAMITAHGSMEAAISALKAGAFDFVSKPVDLQILRNMVSTALKLQNPAAATNTTDEADKQTLLLGESNAMQNIRGKITKLARSQAPIYISGDSGSGKERAARQIHQQGPRADKPFVPVNCGAIPEALMESEFFGHKKGSFTGASGDKAGLFQAADGGTLFLDEVADLPLNMQVKLLRAIQEKAVRPVGAHQEISVDVRILSATHKNLAELVEQGQFRQDLFYRINVIELHMPNLQQRSDDIPMLATHILSNIAKQTGQPAPTLTKNALNALQGYSFPGNIRELENILERAVTLCDDNTINSDDLHLPENLAANETHTPDQLDSHLDNEERQAIQKALEQTKHNKTAAAKLLGISFRALRYRLKKLGLD